MCTRAMHTRTRKRCVACATKWSGGINAAAAGTSASVPCRDVDECADDGSERGSDADDECADETGDTDDVS
jgi:hypothetical protein